jgi:hypothetical protein
MILRSKLPKKAYPTADPKKWLRGDVSNLDPVFAGRLAYLGFCTNTIIDVTDGWRSYGDQEKMYKRKLQGEIANAEKPGRSWHEFSIAIDSSTYPLRGMTNKELANYGLCKPIRSEGWHVQPIETLGQTDRMKFAPVDLAPKLKSMFGVSEATIKYLSAFEYATELAEKLLAGIRVFSEGTMAYLMAYKYWPSLKEKFKL